MRAATRESTSRRKARVRSCRAPVAADRGGGGSLTLAGADHREVVTEDRAGVPLPVVQQPRSPAVDDQGQEGRVLSGRSEQVTGGEGRVHHDPVARGNPQVEQVRPLRADQDGQPAIGRSVLRPGDGGREGCPCGRRGLQVRLLVQPPQGIQGQGLQCGAVTGQQVFGRGCGHQHRHAHRMPLGGQHGHIRRCWQPQLGLRDGVRGGGLRHGSSGVGARGLPRPPR